MAKLTLSLFSPEEIETLHHTSMTILERTGIRVEHPFFLEKLAQAGAQVDKAEQRARLPQALVEWGLAQAPPTFILHGRDPDRLGRFGYGDCNLMSSPGQIAWVEPGSSVRRKTVLADVRQAALLGDALPNVSIVGAMAVPFDTPLAVRDVIQTIELARNTCKPTRCFPISRRSSHYVLEVYAALAGGRAALADAPMTEVYLDPVSPLSFLYDGLEIMMEFADYRQPITIAAMPMAGATAPITLAGTLAQANAEILAGNLLVQLYSPRNPVMYGGIPHIMDMRSGNISFGSPEQGLMAVGMAHMAHHYHLPAYINVNLTDSKALDVQAGMEKTASLLLGFLAGFDLLGHAGIVGNDNAASLSWLALDNEIFQFTQRIAQGLPFDPESLAGDLIDQVGPGSYFIDQASTYKLFRQALWHPSRLWTRDSFDGWLSAGGSDMGARLAAHVEQVLQTHQPPPLDAALDAELERILQAAKKELVAG